MAPGCIVDLAVHELLQRKAAEFDTMEAITKDVAPIAIPMLTKRLGRLYLRMAEIYQQMADLETQEADRLNEQVKAQ